MSHQRFIIIVAVGPVQTFIAAARKLRDLWSGSEMLSELSKRAARSLASQGCELIFPAPLSPADLAASSDLLVANKIVAISPGTADPATIVEETKAAFAEFFARRFEAAKARLAGDFSPCVNAGLFAAQLPDIGEFYAVWSPFDPGNYPRSREEAEALLAARKSLRDFAQPSWNGSGLKKSSLDGVRETVIVLDEADRKRLIRRFLLRSGEELDAIGLVKRCAQPHEGQRKLRFESLTGLALVPYRKGLETREKSAVAEEISAIALGSELLAGFLAGGGASGCVDFLHAEWAPAIRRDLEQNDLGLDGTSEVKRAALEALQKVEQKVSALHDETCQPGKYAAILQGDGDFMGRTINEITDPDQHKAFSQSLAEFAGSAGGIVQDHGGCLIYSGGDDVLAFLPLHSAVQCAKQIRDAFAAKMGQACKDSKPSFSAGLAIVHHRAALTDGLELARCAEKTAKNEHGRDAIAITFSKRSGADYTVGGKWDVFPHWLERLTEFHLQKAVSTKLAYDLLSTLRRISGPLEWVPGQSPPAPQSLAALEAVRVIRHKGETAGAPGAQAASEALIGALAGRSEWEGFARELVLAGELARTVKISKGEW